MMDYPHFLQQVCGNVLTIRGRTRRVQMSEKAMQLLKDAQKKLWLDDLGLESWEEGLRQVEAVRQAFGPGTNLYENETPETMLVVVLAYAPDARLFSVKLAEFTRIQYIGEEFFSDAGYTEEWAQRKHDVRARLLPLGISDLESRDIPPTE